MATGTIQTNAWRFVGSSIGQTAVALPTSYDWSEVFVKAYFPLNDTTVSFVYIQPRAMVASAAGTHGSSITQGFSGADSQACSISISFTDGVYVREYLRNNSSLTSSATFDVYVR